MAKCIRCGQDTMIAGKRICNGCMDEWTDMRAAIFTTLQDKHGKLSPTNHKMFIKETKRLEAIWPKDREKFAIELGALAG